MQENAALLSCRSNAVVVLGLRWYMPRRKVQTSWLDT